MALPLLLLGCDSPTELHELREPVPDPPTQYRTFWEDTEACSGLTGDFEGVRWFWTSYFPGEPDTVGQWNSNREITLLFAHRGQRVVVMHEILHDLLGGDGAHVSPLWRSCGLPIGRASH